MNNLKYIFAIILVIIVCITAYYVSKNNIGENKKIQKEELVNQIQTDIRIGISELDVFNPITTKNRNLYEYTKLLYSSIVNLTDNYSLENDLAKSIEKQDNLTYKIVIVDNAKFSDGSKLTANDIRFTIDKISKHSNIYKENIMQIDTVTAINETEVIIKLKKEVPFFEYSLTFPITKEVSEEVFLNKDKNYIPLSSGKYIIKEIVNNTYNFEKNPNYYKEFNPTIKNIYITKYANMGEIYEAFKQGSVDLITSNEQEIKGHINQDAMQELYIKGRDFNFLSFGRDFTDINVKRGIMQMLKEEELLTGLRNSPKSYTSFRLWTFCVCKFKFIN